MEDMIGIPDPEIVESFLFKSSFALDDNPSIPK